jgi:hypothetical protein
MRISRWVPKTTNTHTEYVILTAIPLQQLVQGRALKLRYNVQRLPCISSVAERCVIYCSTCLVPLHRTSSYQKRGLGEILMRYVHNVWNCVYSLPLE